MLVQLYVTRCYHVWKESELLPWLERNVHTVLDRVDHGDSFVTDSESKRAKRYPTLPRNIHRHIILADFKDVTFSEVRTESPINGRALQFWYPELNLLLSLTIQTFHLLTLQTEPIHRATFLYN